MAERIAPFILVMLSLAGMVAANLGQDRATWHLDAELREACAILRFLSFIVFVGGLAWLVLGGKGF